MGRPGPSACGSPTPAPAQLHSPCSPPHINKCQAVFLPVRGLLRVLVVGVEGAGVGRSQQCSGFHSRHPDPPAAGLPRPDTYDFSFFFFSFSF